MIGWLCTSVTPYYDVKTGQRSFKERPVLIIGQADADDFAALPVSRVTKKKFRHPLYDIQVDPAIFPHAKLKEISYVRTHKQTIVNTHAITAHLCDLRTVYPELYLSIAARLDEYNNTLFSSIL